MGAMRTAATFLASVLIALPAQIGRLIVSADTNPVIANA